MKSIVFDTGPVISLATNNLLWLLDALKKEFKGTFYITKGVERELITRPLESKRFKFEALQVLQHIKKGTLKIVENNEIHKKALRLLDLANNCFKAYDHPINIVNYAEMEVLAAALYFKSSAVVVDERVARELIENPPSLKKRFRRKLHTSIKEDNQKIKEFKKEVNGLKVIRSIELVTIAYELGLLDKYITDIPNPKRTLLESVLWGVKLNGCSVSENEIEQIIRLDIK